MVTKCGGVVTGSECAGGVSGWVDGNRRTGSAPQLVFVFLRTLPTIQKTVVLFHQVVFCDKVTHGDQTGARCTLRFNGKAGFIAASIANRKLGLNHTELRLPAVYFVFNLLRVTSCFVIGTEDLHTTVQETIQSWTRLNNQSFTHLF